MNELSGLELRRAAYEALGWRYATRTNFDVETRCWHAPGCEYAASGFVITSAACKIDCGETVLPAIESDPSVSEPTFLEWCDKNGYSYTTEHIFRTEQQFAHSLLVFTHQVKIATAYGSTPSEARARVIASTADKKK